eukprot:CAMPEP_0170529372 /NCGR_PEP_ID=MMETSP0209-20121228/21456_1 /TAXON_ID=665100 ORGANISM="Litonotus pictus, Strain P1" /NCGR_SAMPLE_ID=MMETSP0209 /ASSEMBLY_ACC=CAM_ASM_000301 /LENGTH=204 /DNA_ID=CAMNT_0010821261 /DNA_START=184 /DNA_END=798 /DNA_ORIENTATION=-
MTNLDERIEQVNRGIQRIQSEHNSKVHVLCYSMASLPLHGFVHKYNGGKFIDSILFLSSPNQGCRLADSVNYNDLEFLEPALRGTGVHMKWFQEEYATPVIQNYNNKFQRSEDIEYYYIGSRTFSPTVQLKYTHNKLYYSDKFIDTVNDGIICLDESPEGVKLRHSIHNHYDLLGLNGKIDNSVFQYYADHFLSLGTEETLCNI